MGKKSLRDVGRNTVMGQRMTPAQETMRREMLEEGTRVHSSILDAVTTPHDDAQRSVVSGGKSEHFDAPRIEDVVSRKLMQLPDREPAKLGNVLEEVVGMPTDEDVREEALMLIREHGDGLVLNWQQWPIVQKLVELGIVSGRAGS